MKSQKQIIETIDSLHHHLNALIKVQNDLGIYHRNYKLRQEMIAADGESIRVLNWVLEKDNYLCTFEQEGNLHAK